MPFDRDAEARTLDFDPREATTAPPDCPHCERPTSDHDPLCADYPRSPFEAGKAAFAAGTRRIVPQDFITRGTTKAWYHGWDTANIAAPAHERTSETPPLDPITAAGLIVSAGTTTPTRPGKQPRPVWTVAGVTAPYESLLRELGGHRWRGTWSFWTDPTTALARALETTAPANYADRQDAKQGRAAIRADRYDDLAARAQARSDAAYETARSIGSGIPFGQPILVGHHSERGHRAALRRIDRNMRRSIDEGKKADYFEHRAEASARTAAGQHSAGFCQRRIIEAEADVRRFTRRLTEYAADAEYCARLRVLLADAEGKAEYWRGQLAAAGGVALDRATVKPGDQVLTRHGWARAVRANPKTVSVRFETHPLAGMTGQYLYAELRGHRRAGQTPTPDSEATQ
jgi:hypothetical protein